MAGRRPETRGFGGWLYRSEFPRSWPSEKLYDLASWTNGMAFRDIHFTATGRPVIKIAEVKNGITGQTKFTDGEYDPCYFVTAGDMLFSWSGQPETSIDVFWWSGPHGWLNQHLFKVEPKEEKCDTRFLYYVLKYLRPNFVAIARNKQTTGLGHVTKEDLKNIEVGIPSRSMQAVIARILGSLDDKIELNHRMNQTLEAIAQAIFKSWFVDFDPVRAKAEGRDPGLPKEIGDLFPDSFQDSELGPIPEGWDVANMPRVMEINPSRWLRKGEVAPYLAMANMPMCSARPVGWKNRPFGSGMRFMNGDVLVARITPCLENGKIAFVDFLAEGQVGWGSTEYIVLHTKPPFPPEYAYFLARSEAFRSYAIKNMTGTSGRQRVPAECFDSYRLVVPTKKSSRQFGEMAESMMATMKRLDSESEVLAGIRDALLPKLLSGELRVPDAKRIVGRCL
jgi:type I restriction enzyme S subunit